MLPEEQRSKITECVLIAIVLLGLLGWLFGNDWFLAGAVILSLGLSIPLLDLFSKGRVHPQRFRWHYLTILFFLAIGIVLHILRKM